MQPSFGEQLKAVRRQRGLVQKQLAEATGVGQATIANYEKGIRFPGEDTLRKLTDVLDVSLDRLFGLSPAGRQEGESGHFLLDETYSEKALISLLLHESLETSRHYIRSRLQGSGISDVEVFNRVLIPLLHTIGRLWESGELTVAQEHIISAKVRQMIPLFSSTDGSDAGPAVNRGTWLGFSAPGDDHDMAMLMLARMMESRGWQAVFLGIGPPLPDLLDAIDLYRPDVVAVSLTISGRWNGLETYLNSLVPRLGDDARIILGGIGLEDHRTVVDSMDLLVAGSLDEAVDMAEGK